MARKKKPEAPLSSENIEQKKKAVDGGAVKPKKKKSENKAVSPKGTAINVTSKRGSNISIKQDKVSNSTDILSSKKKNKPTKKSAKSKQAVEVKKFETKFIDYSDKAQVKREKNRIYQIRFRLVRKLEKAKTKKEQRLVRNEIIRSTKYLTRINKGIGGKVKDTPEMTTALKVEGKTVIREVFKWEVSKLIDGMINDGTIKVFVIDGRRYTKRDSMDILSDIDDMETEADLRDIYFMIVETNLGKKTVSVFLP